MKTLKYALSKLSKDERILYLKLTNDNEKSNNLKIANCKLFDDNIFFSIYINAIMNKINKINEHKDGDIEQILMFINIVDSCRKFKKEYAQMCINYRDIANINLDDLYNISCKLYEHITDDLILN